jgi:glycerol-3-phosphate responsive antiterminator
MEAVKNTSIEEKEFKQKLNIQNAYVEVLKNYHTDLLEKVKKTKKGYQRSKLEVDLFELAQKLDENVSILRNAVNKYNETFEVKK